MAGLEWLFIMILITSSDYGTRALTYQAKLWPDTSARVETVTYFGYHAENQLSHWSSLCSAHFASLPE